MFEAVKPQRQTATILGEEVEIHLLDLQETGDVMMELVPLLVSAGSNFSDSRQIGITIIAKGGHILEKILRLSFPEVPVQLWAEVSVGKKMALLKTLYEANDMEETLMDFFPKKNPKEKGRGSQPKKK